MPGESSGPVPSGRSLTDVENRRHGTPSSQSTRSTSPPCGESKRRVWRARGIGFGDCPRNRRDPGFLFRSTWTAFELHMAERVGFEPPSRRIPDQRFSRGQSVRTRARRLAGAPVARLRSSGGVHRDASQGRDRRERHTHRGRRGGDANDDGEAVGGSRLRVVILLGLRLLGGLGADGTRELPANKRLAQRGPCPADQPAARYACEQRK